MLNSWNSKDKKIGTYCESPLPKIRLIIITVPSNRSSLTPTDEPSKLDEDIEEAIEEGLHGVSEALADGHEREQEVAAASGRQVRQRRRHHGRAVPGGAAAPVHELQLLAGLAGEEAAEQNAGVVPGGRRRRGGGTGHCGGARVDW